MHVAVCSSLMACMQSWMRWTQMRSSTRLPSSSACSKQTHCSSSSSSSQVLPHGLTRHLHRVARVLLPCSGLNGLIYLGLTCHQHFQV